MNIVYNLTSFVLFYSSSDFCPLFLPSDLGGDILFFALSVCPVVRPPLHFVSAQYLENHLSQSLHFSHVDWSL